MCFNLHPFINLHLTTISIQITFLFPPLVYLFVLPLALLHILLVIIQSLRAFRRTVAYEKRFSIKNDIVCMQIGEDYRLEPEGG